MNELDRFFTLLLGMKSDIDTIKSETIRNTLSLDEHMRRTDQNELLVQLQEERIKKLELQDKIMSGMWKLSLAAAGLVGTVLGIIVAIRQLH